MALADHQTREWHIALPSWIVDRFTTERIRATYLRTLQAIANCGDVHDDGIYPIFGGQGLEKRTRCSRATLWRHISTLERYGFLVLLRRGGLQLTGRARLSNQYGIPSHAGALDGKRIERSTSRSDLSDAPQNEARLAESETGSVSADAPQNETGTRLRMRRVRASKRDGYAPQNEAQPSPLPSPDPKPISIPRGNGVSPTGGDGEVKSDGHRITTADLTDTTRLLDLYDNWNERGLIGRTEHDHFRFVSAAEHALREGEEPPALFYSIVKAKRWKSITQADEDAARSRLKAHEPPPADLPDVTHAPAPSPQPNDSTRDDAEIANRMRHELERHDVPIGDMWQRARSRLQGWTEQRWNDAILVGAIAQRKATQ